MIDPPSQYCTKPTKKIISQKPNVKIVKKSKKPKYCVNSNMFSGIFFEYSTNIGLLIVLTNKNGENNFLNHFLNLVKILKFGVI